MTAPRRSFVNRHLIDCRQIRFGQCQFHIACANRINTVPGQTHQTRDRRKRHLLAQRQHQRFKQQCEAIKLTDPRWLNQAHLAIGKAHTRSADFKEAFVLKEIQLAQPFDLGKMWFR